MFLAKIDVTEEANIDSLKDKVQDVEKVKMLHAVDECSWIMAKAARMLGITERMMGTRLRSTA